MIKWKQNAGKDTTWIKSYTLMFVVLSLAVYSLHILYGKSLIYSGTDLSGDGLLQHYTALAYYGEYLRTICRNFFVLHTFSIPEFDLSIGLGGSIITTLGYEVLGDPLNLLAVFVPMQYTEYLYVVLIFFRLYLAGITFCQYCFYHSYNMERILPGAMIYVFSFYTIAVAVLHPFFLNPLIFFPLILSGTDKLLQENRIMPFILSAALAAVSNFYFFYMISIFVFLYCIPYFARLFIKDRNWRQGLRKTGDIVLGYVVSLMLAAPVFLPMAVAVQSSSRMGGAKPIPLFYELAYYVKLPVAFFNASADHYAHLGYGAIAVLAVGLLFMKTKWKEQLSLKAAFLAGVVFLLFPFFGSVLNGFGYATNRWVWAYCFVVAMIVVSQAAAVWKQKKGMAWAIAGATLLFMLPTLYVRAEGLRGKLVVAAIVLFAAAVLLSAVILILWHRGDGMRLFSLTVIAVNIFLSMYSYYSPFSGNYIRNCGGWGHAWEDISAGALGVMEGMDPEEYDQERVDCVSDMSLADVRANSAMLKGINSIAFYFSMIDDSSATFLHEMYLPTPLENQYVNLDGRAFLSSLLGVKYQIVRQGGESGLSYGYSRLVREENDCALYETENALPLAFLYDCAICDRDYETLDVVEKQQIMMQAAVIPDKDTAQIGELSVIDPEEAEYYHRESEYQIVDMQGIFLQNGQYVVTENGAYIQFETASCDEAERYIIFENLWYEGGDSACISVTDGKITRDFTVNGISSNYYAGIHNFLCNMGYSNKHEGGFRIVFSNPGIYSADEIRIQDQPLDCLGEWVSDRKETGVNYSVGEDEIRIQTVAEGDSLLYLSVPYSKGWSAQVDGKDTAIIKTNRFGMGIPVSMGEHTVLLKYHTPYLRFGLVLMIFGSSICFAWSRFSKGENFVSGW